MRFRILLPVVMTVVHLMLWGWSTREVARRADVRTHSAGGLERASFNPAPAVGFQPVERTLGNATRTAILLDFPSVVVGSILGSNFYMESEPAILGFSTLFAPLLWFRIGLGIDRRMGNTPIPVRPWPRVWAFGALLLQVGVVFLLVVAIVGTSPLYHHNNVDSYVIWSAMILWSSSFLAWESGSVRRRFSNT